MGRRGQAGVGMVAGRGDVDRLGPVRAVDSTRRRGVAAAGRRWGCGMYVKAVPRWCCEHTTDGSREGRGALGHATIDNAVARAWAGALLEGATVLTAEAGRRDDGVRGAGRDNSNGVFVLSPPWRVARGCCEAKQRGSPARLDTVWHWQWHCGVRRNGVTGAANAHSSDPCIGARVAGIGSCRHFARDRLRWAMGDGGDCPRRATALTDPQRAPPSHGRCVRYALRDHMAVCALPDCKSLLRRESHSSPKPVSPASTESLIPNPNLNPTLLAPNGPDAAAANLDMPAQLLSLP